MADLPITALTTAGQLSSSDLLYVAIPNPLSPIGFSLCKMTSAQFGIFLNKDLLFASDLTTDSKNIIGAINELKAGGGGGGASVIQLTQAEYTALSTAEKMNGSIYKITDNAKMYCLDEEYHPVKELTTAQYEALTSAEQNNGTIYIQTDAETTADDVEYTSGVSVADKLDNVPTFDTLTTSDNNKLLGVSVSGSDISVGAVGVETDTVTAGTHITIVRQNLYKLGNIKIFSIIFTALTQFTSNEVLFTLPNGYSNTTVNPFDFISRGDDGSTFRGAITGNEVQFRQGTNTHNNYVIQVVFI